MSKRRVVVTGLGLVTPLGSGVARVWKRIISGETGTRAWEGENSAVPCRVVARVPRGPTEDGGFDIDRLFTQTDQRQMTLATMFGLAAAKEAVDVANLKNVDPKRVGVAIGTGMSDLTAIDAALEAFHEKNYRGVSPHFVPLILPNMIAGHVSIKYGFRGPNHCVSTACAAGAHSIGDAFRFVKYGDADVMIGGGSEAPISAISLAGFARARALSTKYNETPARASRPFDAGRDGFVMGEGAGIMVLEELEHARSRGATIYGEILGYGMSADANHLTAPRDDGAGVVDCMRKAIVESGLPQEAVGYINAHATATPLGDIAEISAVRKLFGYHAEKLAVSSTKGALGHLLGAAGVVESICALLACRDGVLPPTANLETPCDPKMNLVAKQAQEWIRPIHESSEGSIRVALSNSFGFGGTNACICLSSFDK